MFTITKRFNWVAIFPYLSMAALILLSIYGDKTALVSSLIAAVFLGIAVLASVYHAEDIAHSIGEGLGTLVLALSITVIEVGLIVSIMSNGGEGASAVARDTVFAAVIIILNGIVGTCLLLGGLKYKEVGFQFRGANSLLVVLIALSVICFILPNFTTSIIGPYYNAGQLIFVSIISILLYGALVISQTKTHKYYYESAQQSPEEAEEDSGPIVVKELLLSFAALLVGLTGVIGLAKFMAPAVEMGVVTLGAPKAVVGLLIATIVLLPEAITAVLAARENRLQTSLNLALGSGAASIALTIPIVSVYSIITEQPFMLGVDQKGMVFLILSFIICSLTLGNGKATALHGIVQLIILFAFFVVTLIP